jgi:hypothetical protein
MPLKKVQHVLKIWPKHGGHERPKQNNADPGANAFPFVAQKVHLILHGVESLRSLGGRFHSVHSAVQPRPRRRRLHRPATQCRAGRRDRQDPSGHRYRQKLHPLRLPWPLLQRAIAHLWSVELRTSNPRGTIPRKHCVMRRPKKAPSDRRDTPQSRHLVAPQYPSLWAQDRRKCIAANELLSHAIDVGHGGAVDKRERSSGQLHLRLLAELKRLFTQWRKLHLYVIRNCCRTYFPVF